MTAILLGILVILGGVVYAVSQQPTPDEARAKAKTPQILSFATNDATRLVISGGEKTTEVERAGSSWTLRKPIETPADAARVEGWLDQLGNLTADRVIDGATDLKQYGLAPAKLSVEVSLPSGKSARLLLGDKTPDGSDYYAQVANDQKVYLVSAPLGDDLQNALTAPPKATPTPTPLPTLVPGSPTAGTPAVTPSAGATSTPAG